MSEDFQKLVQNTSYMLLIAMLSGQEDKVEKRLNEIAKSPDGAESLIFLVWGQLILSLEILREMSLYGDVEELIEKIRVRAEEGQKLAIEHTLNRYEKDFE